MSATMTIVQLAENLELDQTKSGDPKPEQNAAGEEMPEAESPRRAATKPSERDYEIFQRSAFELKPQSELAREYGLSQQRVSQILRNAERWMATHPDDDEAQRMRVRVHSRWEALFGTAMRTFHRSQQDQEIVKERTTRRAPDAAAEKAVTTTMNEKTVKQQNGDVRFLQAAMRVTERQQKLWEPQWEAATNHRPAAGQVKNTEPPVPAPVPASDLVKQEPAAQACENPSPSEHAEKTPARAPSSNGSASSDSRHGGHGHSAGKNGNHRPHVRAVPPHSVLADLLEKQANRVDERIDLAICGKSSEPSISQTTARRFGDVALCNMADVVGSPGS